MFKIKLSPDEIKEFLTIELARGAIIDYVTSNFGEEANQLVSNREETNFNLYNLQWKIENVNVQRI